MYNREDIWPLSNHMVMVSQIASQDKISNYKATYTFLGINLLILCYLICIIKKYVKDTLETVVNFDGLTMVYNRRYFNEYLKRELERSSRYGNPLALIILDIDHFKDVNDTFGHDVGDSVLKELSNLIGSHIRKSDVFARIGGEEFAVIAPETNGENGVILAEKFRKLVEDYDFTNAGKITISLGVTEFTSEDDINQIHKRADNALYKAKRGGRNKTECIVDNNE